VIAASESAHVPLDEAAGDLDESCGVRATSSFPRKGAQISGSSALADSAHAR
jgi:hypothetical protein